MESSFSGTSKRAKAPGNVTQVVHCLVDGCTADLSLCRDYHRRHKVCETHSKTPKVTIGGREQRFCQQCSRFHSLVEFDEGKRSCRKRLDGHNRRRRKPQPDSIPRNSGLLLSSPPGMTCTRLLSFTSPQLMPSTAGSSSWTGVVKPENGMLLYDNHQHLNYNERQNSFPERSSHNYKGVHQIQFSDNPFLDPNASTRTSNGSQKLLSDGLNQVVDGDRALSLLSSAPPLPRSQSLLHDLHYNGIGDYPFTQETKPVIPAGPDSQDTDSSTLHIPGMLHQGPDGSSTTGSHQTLTFMWE